MKTNLAADDHECRGCTMLQVGAQGNGFEEIIAHEDANGRFMTITDPRGGVERYPMGSPIARAYLEVRGLDWD